VCTRKEKRKLQESQNGLNRVLVEATRKQGKRGGGFKNWQEKKKLGSREKKKGEEREKEWGSFDETKKKRAQKKGDVDRRRKTGEKTTSSKGCRTNFRWEKLTWRKRKKKNQYKTILKVEEDVEGEGGETEAETRGHRERREHGITGGWPCLNAQRDRRMYEGKKRAAEVAKNKKGNTSESEGRMQRR